VALAREERGESFEDVGVVFGDEDAGHGIWGFGNLEIWGFRDFGDLGIWKREGEGASAAFAWRVRDVATHAAHEESGDAEAESATARFGGGARVGAVKFFEDAFRVRGRDAGAAVGNGDARESGADIPVCQFGMRLADKNVRPTLRRVFRGVVQNVQQHLA